MKWNYSIEQTTLYYPTDLHTATKNKDSCQYLWVSRPISNWKMFGKQRNTVTLGNVNTENNFI